MISASYSLRQTRLYTCAVIIIFGTVASLSQPGSGTVSASPPPQPGQYEDNIARLVVSISGDTVSLHSVSRVRGHVASPVLVEHYKALQDGRVWLVEFKSHSAGTPPTVLDTGLFLVSMEVHSEVPDEFRPERIRKRSVPISTAVTRVAVPLRDGLDSVQFFRVVIGNDPQDPDAVERWTRELLEPRDGFILRFN